MAKIKKSKKVGNQIKLKFKNQKSQLKKNILNMGT